MTAWPEHLLTPLADTLATLDARDGTLHSVAGAGLGSLKRLEYIVLSSNELAWIPRDVVPVLKRASWVELDDNNGGEREQCSV